MAGDISNMSFVNFLAGYSKVIRASTRKLKSSAFACFVVGDFRDKKGFYRGFVGETIKAFEDAGWGLYNHAILLQPLGTAMLRAGKIFEAGKKLTKVHENILVFKQR